MQKKFIQLKVSCIKPLVFLTEIWKLRNVTKKRACNLNHWNFETKPDIRENESIPSKISCFQSQHVSGWVGENLERKHRVEQSTGAEKPGGDHQKDYHVAKPLLIIAFLFISCFAPRSATPICCCPTWRGRRTSWATWSQWWAGRWPGGIFCIFSYFAYFAYLVSLMSGEVTRLQEKLREVVPEASRLEERLQEVC